MTNWSELKPSGCESCTLRDQPGPCYGSGNPERDKLVYIAQNPGQEEVSREPMQPLVGPSGRIFNRQLFEVGIRRDELFITNQVKCLTPANRAPTGHEIACCRRLLDKELAVVKADTVVLAGDDAFKANIGTYSSLSPHYRPTDSIIARMGCVEQRNGRKWIGTIHPAFILRMPDWNQAALDHLRKAYAIAGVYLPLPSVIEDPTQDDIERHRASARRRGAFADDVETHQTDIDVDEDDYIGGDYQLDMVGYSAIDYEAIILNPSQVAPEWGEIYSDPAIMQCEHNGEYDRYHLEKLTPQLNRRFDTMHAFHYLRNYHASGGGDRKKKSGTRLALKPATVSLFTNLPYYDRSVEAAVGRKFYCGLDNIATLLAAREQYRQLRDRGLLEVFNNIGMKIPHIVEMWRRIGVNIDVRRALLYRKFFQARIDQGEGVLSKLVGPLFNPNSPKQVAELLYDKWQLPKQFNEKREGREVHRTLTTDNEARKRLRKWIAGVKDADRFKPARIFLDLQDFLEGEKTKLTFLDRIAPDFRIHPFFKPHGTKSYRLSSAPNLQNWPVYDVSRWGGARRDTESEGVESPIDERTGEMGSLRSIVIADNPETDLILTVDFEQIELWMYAKQTNCKWLLDIYERGEYIYGRVYEEFYKLPFFQPGKPRKKKFKLPEVSEKFLRRAKAIPLGYLYGRSPEAVAEEHGWTIAEAREYKREWFARCPELLQQYSKDEYQMKQKGWIRYPFGHVIHYPSKRVSEAYAMRGQNPAAGMLLTSIIVVEEALARDANPPARIMLSVHDSLSFNMFNAKRDPARTIAFYNNVLNPILTRCVPELDGFTFRHSCEIGPRWDWDVEDFQDWALKAQEQTGAGRLT